MENKYIEGPKKLTVVIRDNSMFVHLQEPVTYRTVDIMLTDEQRDMLRLKYTDTVAGIEHYENIRECFFNE